MSYLNNGVNDSNFLKCACCGKYKVDTNEDFYINFNEKKQKYWLCTDCNKVKKAFDNSSKDLVLIICPGRNPSEEYSVYSRDSIYR